MIFANLRGGPMDGKWQSISDDKWNLRVYEFVGEREDGHVQMLEHLYQRPENELDYRWQYAGSRPCTETSE